MGRDESFLQKDRRLKEYEKISDRNLQKEDTQLGYRDMNTRFLNAEKQHLEKKDSGSINQVMEAHRQKKLQIEAAWHKNTTGAVKELKRQAPKKGNVKSSKYYEGYSLKDLEVFLKNSDRGGNSDEYNAVATDLELYNRMQGKTEAKEDMTRLTRLKESCDNYLQTRKNPVSSKGNIRKAIIKQLSIKVNAELERQRDEYFNMQKNTMKAMQEEANSENVTAAFRAHHDMIYQTMHGNITLTPEEMQKLDSDTVEVLQKLKLQQVDGNQSKTMCSKYFNALGWAGNAPRLVDQYDLSDHGEETKNSPFPKKLFHSMNPREIRDQNGKVIGREKDAVPLGKQLAGIGKESRLFFGLGRFGKGIYTSARNDDKDAQDEVAMNNSWSYGAEVGAVMLTMMLNENARIITKMEAKKLQEELTTKFPQVTRYLVEADPSSRPGYEDFLTMLVALLGYNTILGDSGLKGIDYLTTTDRKALSISSKMERRCPGDELPDDIDLNKLKDQEEKNA